MLIKRSGHPIQTAAEEMVYKVEEIIRADKRLKIDRMVKEKSFHMV